MNNIQDLKRHKICINFHQNDELIEEYNDEITCQDLIDVANIIFDVIRNSDFINEFPNFKQMFNYMIIQKTFNTNQIGIKVVFRYCYVSPDEFAEDFFKELTDKVHVFCYQWTQDKSSPKDTDEIKYLTTQKRLVDLYDDVEWPLSIDSFSQIYSLVGENIHRLVNSILSESDTFIGLGGESGYYVKAAETNNNKFSSAKLFTNSYAIHQDCQFSNFDSHLVDYNSFELTKYYSSNDGVLLINISRKGLKKLAKQINKLQFKQIIYIGCDLYYINQDLQRLDRYTVHNMTEFKIDDHNSRFVVDVNLKN